MINKNFKRVLAIALLSVSLTSCNFYKILHGSNQTPDTEIEKTIDANDETEKTESSDGKIAVNIKSKAKKDNKPKTKDFTSIGDRPNIDQKTDGGSSPRAQK